MSPLANQRFDRRSISCIGYLPAAKRSMSSASTRAEVLSMLCRVKRTHEEPDGLLRELAHGGSLLGRPTLQLSHETIVEGDGRAHDARSYVRRITASHSRESPFFDSKPARTR